MSKTVMFIYGGLAHADWLESVARALRGTRLHDPRPARGLSKMCRSRSCGVPRVDRERRGLKSAASSAMATSRGPTAASIGSCTGQAVRTLLAESGFQ